MRVLVNRCYGSFDLSQNFQKHLWKNPETRHYVEFDGESYKLSVDTYKELSFRMDENVLAEADKILNRGVRLSANCPYADVEIRTIPDGINLDLLKIENYDGFEFVAVRWDE